MCQNARRSGPRWSKDHVASFASLKPSNRAEAAQGLVYTNRDSPQLIRIIRTGSLRRLKYGDAHRVRGVPKGAGQPRIWHVRLASDGRRDAAVLQISAMEVPGAAAPAARPRWPSGGRCGGVTCAQPPRERDVPVSPIPQWAGVVPPAGIASAMAGLFLALMK